MHFFAKKNGLRGSAISVQSHVHNNLAICLSHTVALGLHVAIFVIYGAKKCINCECASLDKPEDAPFRQFW